MSRLKVDNIETRSGNNVAMDDSLQLKSYDTTARDALTSVAGDMIYNSDDNKPQFYDGTSWNNFSAAPSLLPKHKVLSIFITFEESTAGSVICT